MTFTGDYKCPKCSHNYAVVQYYSGAEYGMGEWLNINCRVCHYSWNVDCDDKKEDNPTNKESQHGRSKRV